MTVAFGKDTLAIIQRWCKKNKVDPDCISAFDRAPKPKPGVTYKPIAIKELKDLLEHTNMTLYVRSKPVKERSQ